MPPPPAPASPRRERLLVSVGPAPASAHLVREGKRLADGLGAAWTAAHVHSHGRPLGDADRERVEAHLRAAEALGASVVRLTGSDIATPLLTYARSHHVTRMIVGKPTHPWLLDRLRGSLLDDLVRASGAIEVHVAAPAQPEAEPPTRARAGRAELRLYAFTTLLVAATAGLVSAARALYPLPDLEMLFLLAVMLTAARFGRGPSLWAAVLSVLAYDFFFVPPALTLEVQDAHYFFSFAVMIAVGAALGETTARLRRQEQDAVAREGRASALYALSRSLGGALDPSSVAREVARHAADCFDADVALLAPDEQGVLRSLHAEPADFTLSESELRAASACLGSGEPCVFAGSLRLLPLVVEHTALGLIALAPVGGTALASDPSFLASFCRQAAFALSRARLAQEAQRAAMRAHTEQLRSSLLSAVSHDLRTPLASITGAATALRDDPGLARETRHELLETVCEEADRLERLVTNLLDMTRIQSGAMEPRREWVPLEEIVGSALTRLEQKLRTRRVDTAVTADFPLLSVDPVLMQQVFVNLLENVAKYTPEGSGIEIEAHAEAEVLRIELRDFGPGLGPHPDRLFEKFQRGQVGGVSGAGLGLAISRAIVEAHGGSLNGQDRATGGALFRLSLPRPLDYPELSGGDS